MIPNVKFRFIAIFAGFIPRNESLREMVLASKPEVESFHCIGEADKVVATSLSVELADLYPSPVVCRHEGGHMVPSFSHVRRAFKEFAIREHGAVLENGSAEEQSAP